MSRPRMGGWRRAVVAIVVLLLLSRFLAFGWRELLANFNSNGGDQGAYLELGLAIREGRALTDGNRHPLFPLLIAPFARREWSYFTLTKLAGLAYGGLALLATFAVGRRLYNVWAALLTTAMLAANQEFLVHAPQVLCESLFVLTFLLAWYASVRSLEHPSSVRAGLPAGALTGLAYLTKGTGMLLALCFVASMALLSGRKIIGAHGLWAFVGGFVLIISPLMVYNSIQYGSPLYNFNTTHAMWFDDWDQRYASQGDFPTAWTYLRSHSMAQILARQGRGMVAMLPIMADAFFPGPGRRFVSWLQDGWIWLVMGLEFLLLSSLRHSATITAYLVRRLPRVLMAGLALASFYLLFSWYAPIADGPRFFLPLVPILYLTLAEALISVAQRSWGHLSHLPRLGLAFGSLVGVCLLSWTTVGSVQALEWADPFLRDRLANADADQVVGWLNGRAQDDVRILWGPSHALPKWKFVPQITYQAIPSDLRTWEELEHFISRNSFHYIVLDPEMCRQRTYVLSPYVDMDETQVRLREVPPGWTLAFAQEGGTASPEWEGTNWYIIELSQPGMDGARTSTPAGSTSAPISTWG